MKRTLLLIVLSLQSKIFSQNISPLVMGQSYYSTSWATPTAPAVLTSSNLTNHWPDVTNSGATLIRVGGAQYNVGSSKPPTNNEIYYVQIVDDIRSHGCEPVITLPFPLTTMSITSTAAAQYTTALNNATLTAQKIVTLLNVTHKRNVKYFVLANEPGIDYGWSDPSLSLSASSIASLIAGYVKPMAQAIKAIDPTIKIIGPEFQYYYTSVYSELFPNGVTGSNSIAGTFTTSNGATLPYIDYISFHDYYLNFWSSGAAIGPSVTPNQIVPGNGNVWTRDMVYTELEKYTRFYGENEGKRVRGEMREVRQRCTDISNNRSIPMGWMITEANSSQNNENGTYTVNPSGLDTRSMLGSQNLARIYALGMEYGATAIIMWSAIEGAGGFDDQNRGFIDYISGNKRGTYYHYQMMAKYFKGTYLKDKELETKIGGDDATTQFTNTAWLHWDATSGSSVTNQAAYNSSLTLNLETKAFGAKGADLVVMVLNHKTSTVSISINFAATTPTGTANKKFSFDAGISQQVDFSAAAGTSLGVIPAESTTMLFFDCNGNIKKRMEYTRATEAQSYGTDFTAVFTASGYSPFIPSVTINPTTQCLGLNTSTITINNMPGGAFVNWHKLPSAVPLPGNPYATLAGCTPGIYETSIDQGGFCGQYDLVNVIHHKSPIVDAGPDINLCAGGTQSIGMLNVTAPSGQTYTWFPSTYTNAVKSVDVTNTPSTTGYVLAASDGTCTLSDGVIVVNSSTPDVMIKDAPDDLGNQPNNESNLYLYNYLWSSPDIWVRNSNDGGTEHQNPVSNTTNYINVLITNRSCAAANNVTLSVYTAKAGAGQQWSTGWVGTPSCSAAPFNFGGCTSTLLCGGTIGTVAVNVPSMSTITQTLAWSVPNASLYTCMGNTGYTPGHWCLQAQLNHSVDAINSPSALTGYDWGNMYNKNNVATKNVEIYYETPGNPIPRSAFFIANTGSSHKTRLLFTGVGDANGENLLGYGRPRFRIAPQYIESWKDGGKKGQGILLVNDSTFEVIDPQAQMENIVLRKSDRIMAALQVKPLHQPDSTLKDYFNLDVLAQNDLDSTEIIGGIRHSVYKGTWDFTTCATTTVTLSGSITNTQTITGDSVLITDNITVGSRGVLTFSNTTILVAEGKSISVSSDGKLIMTGCDVAPACIGTKWGGITVSGSSLSINSLNINNSFITGADNPVNASAAQNLSICSTSFLGYNNDTCIKLSSIKGFTLNDNSISGYMSGIKTQQSISHTSSINKNIITNVATAISFSNDAHDALDVFCNRFNYSDYAIYSYSTTLKDQGSSTTGADNEFISSSSETFDKINQVSGNSPTYYYSSSFPVTSGISISTSSAAAARECYTYSFDTTNGGGSRVRSPLASGVNSYSTLLDLKPIPNPSAGKTSIYYNLGTVSSGEIYIRDIQGRLVEKMKVLSDKPKVDVDYSHLYNGIYFITLINSKGESLSRKMILEK